METQQLHRLFLALVIAFCAHQIVEAYQGQGLFNGQHRSSLRVRTLWCTSKCNRSLHIGPNKLLEQHIVELRGLAACCLSIC